VHDPIESPFFPSRSLLRLPVFGLSFRMTENNSRGLLLTDDRATRDSFRWTRRDREAARSVTRDGNGIASIERNRVFIFPNYANKFILFNANCLRILSTCLRLSPAESEIWCHRLTQTIVVTLLCQFFNFSFFWRGRERWSLG